MPDVEEMFWPDGNTNWGTKFRDLIRALNSAIEALEQAGPGAVTIPADSIQLTQLAVAVRNSLAKADAAVTTAQLDNRIAALLGAAPTAYDTLQEIATYIASDQTQTSGFVTALAQRAIIVEHGATAGIARPGGAKSVIWIGSAEPTNRILASDIWIGPTGVVVASGTGGVDESQLIMLLDDATSDLRIELDALYQAKTSLPPANTYTVLKVGTVWPPRPTADPSARVFWQGVKPAPQLVASGTGGMHNRDNFLEETA